MDRSGETPVRDPALPADEVHPHTAPLAPRLPYFEAHSAFSWYKERWLYRVYVTGTDLLCIGLGSADQTQGAAQGAALAATGGAIGGLIGAAVAWGHMKQIEVRKKQIELRQQLLDDSDESALRLLAASEKNGFRAAVDELQEVRINAPSGWKSVFGGKQCVALLNFTHAQHGAMTLELPTHEDVRIALAELPRLFGPAVQTNLSWRSF